jgi:hypothetical protein
MCVPAPSLKLMLFEVQIRCGKLDLAGGDRTRHDWSGGAKWGHCGKSAAFLLAIVDQDCMAMICDHWRSQTSLLRDLLTAWLT